MHAQRPSILLFERDHKREEVQTSSLKYLHFSLRSVMNFIHSLKLNPIGVLLGKEFLAAVGRLTGQPLRCEREVLRNYQCVKLSKDHTAIARVVSYWCDLRINKLRQMGAAEQDIARVVKHDARFLTILAAALQEQLEEEPAFDAWLFFNEDVQATHFFELQHCARGSKATQASFIIRATV